MGCGCLEQATIRGNYDNTRQIAIRYAKSEGCLVVIYRTATGFNFLPFDCEEADQITPFEYVSPVQGDTP